MRIIFLSSPACLLLVYLINGQAWHHCAFAYTSESMPSSQSKRLGITHYERPLAPPFPNGPCDGTVVSILRKDLFPGQANDRRTFLNLNLDPFSSLENVLLPPRDVKVWLPKGYYENRSQRYPVLYCHDGQNAMDDASSWTGSSWRLIGALTRLSERKMLHTHAPPIVVCIPCGEGWAIPGMPRRHSEYGDYTHPVSQAHGEFVATKLHPYIMNKFRVKEGPQHTSTIGSSLGGQASLQLVLRYPELFGGAACLSPCFQPGTIAAAVAMLVADDEVSTGISRSESNKKLMNQNGGLETNHNSLRSKRIYIDNGGDVDDTRVPVFDAMDHFTLNDRWWNPGYFWLDSTLQPTIDAMRWTLDQGGVKYVYKKIPGGRHNERAWANRIHHPLLALYGKTSD